MRNGNWPDWKGRRRKERERERNRRRREVNEGKNESLEYGGTGLILAPPLYKNP